MEQGQLIKHLTKHGCYLKRHGGRHDIYVNTKNGRSAPVPTHLEIAESLCKLIKKQWGRMKEKTHRLIISGVFMAITIVGLLLLCYFKKKYFYSQAFESQDDWLRVLWLIPFLTLGLSIRAFIWRNYKSKYGTSPWPPYIGYFLKNIISCIIVFSILHLSSKSSNWIYYPLSACIIVTFGLIPDKVDRLLRDISPKY